MAYRKFWKKTKMELKCYMEIKCRLHEHSGVQIRLN